MVRLGIVLAIRLSSSSLIVAVISRVTGLPFLNGVRLRLEGCLTCHREMGVLIMQDATRIDSNLSQFTPLRATPVGHQKIFFHYRLFYYIIPVCQYEHFNWGLVWPSLPAQAADQELSGMSGQAVLQERLEMTSRGQRRRSRQLKQI